MKLNSENVAKWMIGICFLSLCVISLAQRKPLERSKLSAPYTIDIIDEHEVQCVSGGDTITLLLENAYSLSEESRVYIEFKKK